MNVGWFFLSHRLPLALGARDAGYDVHIASDIDSPEERRAIEERGLKHHRLRIHRSGMNPVEEVRLLWQLLRLYKDLKPSLVHHVTHKPTIYGGIAAQIRGIPATVSAISGLGYSFTSTRPQARISQLAIWAAYRVALRHRNSRVIFQNRDDLQLYTTAKLLDSTRAVLIPGSGVDLDEFAPQPESPGSPVVLFPARMLRDKGLVELLEASNILRQRSVNFRLRLAGGLDPGNPASLTSQELLSWLRRTGAEWVGHQLDMPRTYAEAHIVCLPSYREGLPKSLIEAAACGRAIVTTDVPGCRDTVLPGQSGFLVPPRDPISLADTLEELIVNDDRRRLFGCQSRRYAEKTFDIRHVVDATLAIYRELLDA